ncbi:MAG: type VI secretion system baseplate subunit TssF, partial [Deltaproteobacteria bacterium]|nr:type VI secretion system baseplate subunit TssF [Deltaproteobacteria bacterium]
MLKDYYQQELANLRELGVEFSRDNPALAPMLAAKGDDPDVERLLEGVAFLSSLIRRKLSEGFPDFIESLLKVVFPQVLLPTPSATMMHFRPVEGFNETIKLAKGSLVASIPIEGAQAKFATTTDLTIVPAAVTKVLVKDESNGEKSLSLLISSSAPLSTWLTDSLSIHLAGDYPEASERRKILLDNVLGLTASVRSQSLSLPPDLIGPAGFASTIRSFNREPLTAFELTQDYFIMPQKLLFLKVSGLKPLCQSTQNALTLTFRLSGLKGPLPAMRPEHFLLNICPAVNIFPYPAHPLTVDHRHNEYLLRPQDFESEKLDIYLVSKVASLLPSGETLKYVPFESFAEGSENERLYSVARRPSPITGLPEHYLSVIYPKNSPDPTKETLSISLMCHNLGLTDYLHSGEIKEPTDTSPAMSTFANIIPPTNHSPPVATDAQLWYLLSHL